MIGSEEYHVANEYYKLTANDVYCMGVDEYGTFVERVTDHQLAQFRELRSRPGEIEDASGRKNQIDENIAYPRLPLDSVLCVRKENLDTFLGETEESTMEIIPPGGAHISRNLQTLNTAAVWWWGKTDQDGPGAITKSKEVIEWLEERGFSKRLAKCGATIIRPDWVPEGRPRG